MKKRIEFNWLFIISLRPQVSFSPTLREALRVTLIRCANTAIASHFPNSASNRRIATESSASGTLAR